MEKRSQSFLLKNENVLVCTEYENGDLGAARTGPENNATGTPDFSRMTVQVPEGITHR